VNVPERRQKEFAALQALDLKVCRARAIKENQRRTYDYRYAAPMRKCFKRWYFWSTRSRLKLMIADAKTPKAKIENIVAYVKHRITNALK
jgi:transposase